ncbi:peptidoglycan DD-metalloendopeptidase family protein [Allochromatium vinosum]|uniref:Peptidase M23 n=1 Tax=Allochromatium vinosum (strain ATCC 17899 / DSM 180 / NBRC 103801 / NCIMB 10441 / D) TaxID=572477 RepID=D3RQC1_ALLVD|nr:peptidoglycan DD-metalloendopeptidase family protein [Allochromatium vinosum]ADC61726.1 Peptidase M23 [Allochromatium vinosum DSM 180]
MKRDALDDTRMPVVSSLLGLALTLLIAGCASKSSESLHGRYWSGPVPDGYYLIRSGDSLGLIAQRLGVSQRRLVRWNRLEPPYTIYADTLLRIAPPDVRSSKGVRKPPAPLLAEAPQPAAPSEASTPTDRPEAGRTPVNRTVEQTTKTEPPQATKAAKPRAGSRPAARTPTREGPGSRRGPSGVDWEWPLTGPLVQTYSERDRTRHAIRIGGRSGDQVKAAAEGQVVYSGSGLKGYGNLIIIKHSEKYLSAYGFNRRLLVTEGERVNQGQVVAEVGQGADGAYLLHFEVRRHGQAVDPILYLPARP